MTAGTQRTAGTTIRVQGFWLKNPATGTNTVAVTFSAAVTFKAGGAVSMTSVDQTTSEGAEAGGTGTGNPTTTVTSAVNELVVDGTGCNLIVNSPTAATVGGGQTQRWNVDQGGNGVICAGSTEAGAASVAMDWTTDDVNDWGISGISAKAASATPNFYSGGFMNQQRLSRGIGWGM